MTRVGDARENALWSVVAMVGPLVGLGMWVLGWGFDVAGPVRRRCEGEGATLVVFHPKAPPLLG